MSSQSTPLSQICHVELQPGTIIGEKYRIDGFLGAGGMGVVLSATHLDLDAPVAIKIVRDELAQNEEIVSRLLFEARAAARMRGRHIVRVLDVARLESGAPYIVMEQLHGSDLDSLLAERGTLTVPEAVGYLLQACEGLAEAHGLGIIHRDLKPENLFLATTPEGVVLKILDFGISKDVGTSLRRAPRSTLTRRGAAVGSPYYMAPEQMRAAPDLDSRADIWSLGAILFELLTGKCPFEAESPALLCAKVMVDEPPSLREFSSSAPEQLDVIVRRCLAKEPSARFQTVTELAAALRNVVARETREAREASEAREALPQTEPRSKSGIALAAVMAFLVVAAAAFWHLQGHPERWPWPETDRAAAVELPPPVKIDAPRAPEWTPSRAAEAKPPAQPPIAASIAVSPAGKALGAAPAKARATQRVSTTAAPVGSRDASASAQRSAAPIAPDLDSVGARYDL